jgi:hypothetical protein
MASACSHAGSMQFTEYELTAAVTGATKSVMAGKKLRKRGVDVDAGWDAMDRYHRFKLLDAVGQPGPARAGGPA